MVFAGGHESVVWSRGIEREAVLDLESGAGGGSAGDLDGSEGVLFLQYRHCTAGGAGEGDWTVVVSGCHGGGGRGGTEVLFGE